MSKYTKPALVAALAAFAVGGVGTATAAKLITGDEIARETLTGKNVQDGSLRMKELTPKLQLKIKSAAGTTTAGVDGKPGANGVNGVQGGAGPKGEQGEKGDVGPAGPKGAKGETGAAGAKGEKGDVGPKGDTGAQGVAGTAGADGANGTDGTDGTDGVSGYEVIGGEIAWEQGVHSATQTCPEGKVAIGGGFKTQGTASSPVIVTSNGPTGLAEQADGTWSATSWTIVGENMGAAAATVDPYVICAAVQ